MVRVIPALVVGDQFEMQGLIWYLFLQDLALWVVDENGHMFTDLFPEVVLDPEFPPWAAQVRAEAGAAWDRNEDPLFLVSEKLSRLEDLHLNSQDVERAEVSIVF